MSSTEIELIPGGLAIDDRGSIAFCNDFDMADVERFYMVSNHQKNFIRAWHAHKNEAKFVFVPSGAIMLRAVKVDRWEQPDKNLDVTVQILDVRKPGVLFIPGGYAHGFMTLTELTSVMFFSTSRLKDSLDDDYRYPYDYWGPWEILHR